MESVCRLLGLDPAALEVRVVDALPPGVQLGEHITAQVEQTDVWVVLLSGTGTDNCKQVEIGAMLARLRQLAANEQTAVDRIIPLVLPFYCDVGLEQHIDSTLTQVLGLAGRAIAHVTKEQFVQLLVPKLLGDLSTLGVGWSDEAQRAKRALRGSEVIEAVSHRYEECLDPVCSWARELKDLVDDPSRVPRLRYEAWLASRVLQLALGHRERIPRDLRPRMRLGHTPRGEPISLLCIAPLQLRTGRRPVWLAWFKKMAQDGGRDERRLAVVKEDVTPPQGAGQQGEKEWLESLTGAEAADERHIVPLVAWGKHDRLRLDGHEKLWIATPFCLGGTLQQFSGVWKKVVAQADDRGRFNKDRYLRTVWARLLGPLHRNGWADAPHLAEGLAQFRQRLTMAFGTGRYERWLADEAEPVPSSADADREIEQFLATVCSVFRQVASVISVLRSKHVVHADIKPANILLDLGADDKLEARLCDFDAARAAADDTAAEDAHSHHAATVTLRATPGFDAPEIHHRPTHRSDVYSLCVSVATTLTSLHRLFGANEVLPRLRVWGVPEERFGLSDVLTELLLCGTSRTPHDRPSPEELERWFKSAAERPTPTVERPVPLRLMRDRQESIRDHLILHLRALPGGPPQQEHQRALALSQLEPRPGSTGRELRSFGHIDPSTVGFALIRESPTRVWLAWHMGSTAAHPTPESLVVVREQWNHLEAAVPGHQVDLRVAADRKVLELLQGSDASVNLVSHGYGWHSTSYVHGGSLEQRYFRLWAEAAGELSSTEVMRRMRAGLIQSQPNYPDNSTLRDEINIVLPEVVAAVRRLHALGVTHRALCLEEILVDRGLTGKDALDEGSLRAAGLTVRLAQFGFAHHSSIEPLSSSVFPLNVNRWPPSVTFNPVDPRIDAAACCRCLIEVLTARRQAGSQRDGEAAKLREMHVRPEVVASLIDAALLDGQFAKADASTILQQVETELRAGVFDLSAWQMAGPEGASRRTLVSPTSAQGGAAGHGCRRALRVLDGSEGHPS